MTPPGRRTTVDGRVSWAREDAFLAITRLPERTGGFELHEVRVLLLQSIASGVHFNLALEDAGGGT